MKKILFGLLALVFAEIAVFIVIGNAIGVFYTLLLIIFTSIAGLLIAKKRGTKSIQDIQKSMQQGQPPGVPVIETFMIFVGGILLAVPGFITDILGLLFVSGITRNLFKPVIFYFLRKKMKRGQVVILQK
ncbi:FxsA family protein [Solibacillus isronensis]|uniref:FxsA family protein n=1 Tax=Solibacillus isronensis TaxID=412383 RepID=UPI00203F9CEC|nr:FxsA family protein [Solibacillus isronensis]MCM3720497.1 FxsA family protein [Solibacillus isronensis]